VLRALPTALLLAATLAAPPRASAEGEKALRIADQMMEALGGQDNWDRARFIRFTFDRRGRRLNITWDRYTGAYRLEATNDRGVPYVVVMNLHTRQGRVALEGHQLAGAELSEYLTRASHIWAGETYWLLMPLKLRDPGVILSYEGDENVGGVDYDIVHLRFDNVGFTPGDEFWAYVNRETHLMDRWKFKLESGTEGDFRWSNWQRFGGILLATERTGADGEIISFQDIVVADSLPGELFTTLDHVTLR
jgi:hypothetical protein